MDVGGPHDLEFKFQTVGEKLKAAREQLGLSLNDVAIKTRVPLRHLEAIERSQFSALPGITYTLGFAKAYARAVELNDGQLGSELRNELSQGGHDLHSAPMPNYEPTDPARVPSASLAWVAAGLAAHLLIGYFVWRSFALSPSLPDATSDAAEKAVVAEKTTAGPAADPAAGVDPKGQVTLTATDTVWLRVYDADKKRLFEKEMQAGEKYDVPADANNPMINTGRPQSIVVNIGGKALGPPDRAISDVGVSAAALLGRDATPVAEGSDKLGSTEGNAPTR
jgi:cytoskeletal protein RodZ